MSLDKKAFLRVMLEIIIHKHFGGSKRRIYMYQRFFLFFLFIVFHLPIHAKIYDCFLFFNELDVLEIRLNELYDHVDAFVLVESIETFRGNPKPLYYLNNQERFKQFSDKIIHIIVYENFVTDNPWNRENYQRNQIMRGLFQCSAKDIIMVSDVDEIVRAKKLPEILDMIYRKNIYPVRCHQPLYRYYLNSFDNSITWSCGTYVTKFSDLVHKDLDHLRSSRGDFFHIENAGWHFTSMGGLTSFIAKMESFSHSDFDTPEIKNQSYINKYMSDYCKIVPIDNSYPEFVINNESYLNAKGLIFSQSFD
jgi:Glycosyltransferase family 17